MKMFGYIVSISQLQIAHLLQLPRFLKIFLNIKLSKQKEEHDSMCSNVIADLPGKATILIKQELEAMSHNPDELDHL